MCGRYTFSDAEASKLGDRFDFLDAGIALGPRYNVAPTQDAPVVVRDDVRRLEMMRWGLVPSWAKTPDIGARMINARCESVAEKPSFKHPLRRRRCLAIADGFYEWAKVPGRRGKTPMRFVLNDGSHFAFAGLWDSWHGPDGRELRTFTIITTEANELVRPVHNRMPVVLLPEQEDLWVDPSVSDPAVLLPLLRPHPPERMESYEVSAMVNSPSNDRPECIAPVGLFGV